MSAFSGFFLAAAFMLAVALGGKTHDFTWGPGLAVLGVALWTAGGGAANLRERGRFAWVPTGMVLGAVGWIFWRAADSPVAEFARADALLATAALAGFVWAFLMRPEGAGWRVLCAGLALLVGINLAVALIQKGNSDYAALFASRPGIYPSGLFGHYNHLADFSLVAAAFLGARALLGGECWLEKAWQATGALAAVACVALSWSRGGMLSLSVAVLVLTATGLAIAWRRRSRWIGPLCGFAAFAAILMGVTGIAMVKSVQEKRGGEGEVASIADSAFRLGMIGLALDLTEKHPWVGGGSRSFGWEKYDAWDLKRNNRRVSNDDFVHNGAMQLAVEYGWTGLGLVTGALLVCGAAGFAGLVAAEEEGSGSRKAADAVACGGLAALAGTVFHSNFSFVHHTLPGAMYLGLALGACSPWRRSGGNGTETCRSRLVWSVVLLFLLLAPAVILTRTGWRGALAYREAWPVLFGKERLGRVAPEEAVNRLDVAYDLWPCAEFPAQAAAICRAQAALKESSKAFGEARSWLEQAESLYRRARESQPYDPEWVVNHANVLSTLGHAAEAEREFRKGVEMQGGMEGGFRARYFLASHLYREGYRLWTMERRSGEGLTMFLEAKALLAQAERESIGKERSAARQLVPGLQESINFLERARVKPEPRQDGNGHNGK